MPCANLAGAPRCCGTARRCASPRIVALGLRDELSIPTHDPLCLLRAKRAGSPAYACGGWAGQRRFAKLSDSGVRAHRHGIAAIHDPALMTSSRSADSPQGCPTSNCAPDALALQLHNPAQRSSSTLAATAPPWHPVVLQGDPHVHTSLLANTKSQRKWSGEPNSWPASHGAHSFSGRSPAAPFSPPLRK